MGAPRKRARLRNKLLLLAGGLVFALVLCEVAVRILWSSLAPPKDVDIEYLVVAKPFPGRGTMALPNYEFEARYDGDPYDTLPDGDVVHYRQNDLGFREEPFGGKRPEAKFLVAVLGDSFVFGEGVIREATMTRQCESFLAADGIAGPRVLNLGVPGYASEDQRDLSGYVLPRLLPDVVLLGYCLNDPVHLNDQVTRKGLGFDLIVRRDEKLGNDGGGRSPSYLVRLLRNYLDTKRLNEETVRWYRSMYEGPEAPWIKSREYILEMRDEAKRYEADFAVFIMPLFFQLDDYPFEAVHEAVARWCREHDIPVLDTLPLFRGKSMEEVAVHPKDHHPNHRSHRILGEAIARFVTGLPK